MKPSGEQYNLIVVGAGISGLSAAWFYRERNPNARILLLDNHDDFGGHARPNEFHIGGRLQLMNGGTPGIDPPVFGARFPRFNPRRTYRLRPAMFFDRETFGEDRLVVGTPATNLERDWKEFLDKTPLSEAAARDVLRLETGTDDYLPDSSDSEKKDLLSRISYAAFATEIAKVDPGVLPFH